ncbi:MAG TPA: hypothetical protein VGK67_08235 [Myxococcales bacterium]|jgi:tetratricopeptide (TPR) repeat protein
MRRLLIAAALALAASACSKNSSAPAPSSAAGDKAGMPAGHPAVPAKPAAPPIPKDLAEKLGPLQERMKAEPRSFAAAAAVGDLLFDNSRYVDAVDLYRQALERGAETLTLLDEVSVKAPAKLPQAKDAGCESGTAAAVPDNDSKARARRDKGDFGAAVVCARAAAAPILGTASRRAQALFLVGNVDQAVGEYEKVLKRDPDAAEALFFLGALQLNRRGAGPAGLQAAAGAWKHFLEVAPKDHPRRAEVEKTLPSVENALANAAKAGPPAADLPPGHPPMEGAAEGEAPKGPGMGMGAMGGMAGMGAAGHEGHEGIEPPVDLEKALGEAESALAKGDGATAAKAYMGAMNSAPDDPRVQAGLAASQFLKGTAMAQKVFEVAVARDPKAVDDLAGRLSQKGNAGLARTLRQQLLVAAPDYAAKTDLKSRAK